MLYNAFSPFLGLEDASKSVVKSLGSALKKLEEHLEYFSQHVFNSTFNFVKSESFCLSGSGAMAWL